MCFVCIIGPILDMLINIGNHVPQMVEGLQIILLTRDYQNILLI